MRRQLGEVCVCVCNIILYKYNYILYFINIIIIFFNVNTNYTFHSVFMNFYIYSKIITKGSNNLNNILETIMFH